ncbi:MAG: TatD family nuclease-associated radical SAM protein [Clostridia bacterium]|nr:TatD family nuclease-associated radical SAM protein [Clostridia bacterium]
MVNKGKIYSYAIGDSLYLNLTNRCPNRCCFCIREFHDGVGAEPLWLEREPSAQEVLDSIDDLSRYKEIVFCGFGEPLSRVDVVVELAKTLRPEGIPVRINTNGLANLIHKRNIVPELAGLVDVISISLNAENVEKYQELCQPVFGEKSYEALLEFARECVKVIPKVIMTVVNKPEVDVPKSAEIAHGIGAEFRVRTFL